MSAHLDQRWTALRDRMLGTHTDVAQGRMMSADALTYQGKVFAFFSTKGGRIGLGCKIGRDVDPANLGLRDWQHLAPFKTKPPMKDWIVLGEDDLLKWDATASLCLDRARNEGR